MDRDRTVKTATARAIEAIEAAQMMFADEMGATLDLSPAARVALIEKIAAAIQTAIAEEQQKLELTDEGVLPSSTC
jgi:rhamnose utilization protein RhaD (predicted bifunctional aldolase and dehydrogenase)